MAEAITSQFGNANCPQLRLTVTVGSETASQATLSWSLDYVAHGYAASTSVAKSYSAVIAGETVASGSFNINGITGTRNIDSGTKVITKSNSSQTISFSCSMAFNLTWGGTYGGTKTGSGSITINGKTSYTISYNANGGSGAPSPQTKWYGVNIALSSTRPSRSGYIFQGWATSSGGSVQYQPGDTYTANASVTLYAIWGTSGYTVSYNANGGSGAPSSQTKQHNVTLILSRTVPTRTNYEFLGWGTSSSSTTVSYSPGDEYTRNASITLYAIWKSSYNVPGITNMTVDRSDSAGNLSESGTYAKVVFDWSTEKTVQSIQIQYKQTTSSSYTSVSVSASGTSGSVTKIIGGSFNEEYSYDIRVTVRDSGGSSYMEMVLPAMSYIIDFLKGGTGVAIGGPSTQNGFEVVMNSKFIGNVGIGKEADETDFPFDIDKASLFRQAVTMRNGLNIAYGDFGLAGQMYYSSAYTKYPFLDFNRQNPMFLRNVILENEVYLQAMTSSGSPSNILRMNSSGDLELYWPSGGIQGRMCKLLYSGTVSQGGSVTVSEHQYYRILAVKPSNNNALLLGIKQNPASPTTSGQTIQFQCGWASTGAHGTLVATFNVSSSTRLTYTAGWNSALNTQTASSLGNISQIWGIL